MKTSPYTLLFLFAIITMKANGQATANVAVSIIAPTTISKISEGFSTPMDIDPTKQLTPERKARPNSKRDLNKSQTIEVPAAKFTLSNSSHFTYSVSLPRSSMIVRNGSRFVTIDGFSVDNSATLPSDSGSNEGQNILIKAKVNFTPTKGTLIESEANDLSIVVNFN